MNLNKTQSLSSRNLEVKQKSKAVMRVQGQKSYGSHVDLVPRESTVQSASAVPDPFGTRDRFPGRQFSHGPGEGGWFRDDSSALHLLCILFLLLLHCDI